MDLAFASSSLFSVTGNRASYKIRPFMSSSLYYSSKKFSIQKKFHCSATTVAANTIRSFDMEIENKKDDLLRAIQDTQRGLVTTPDKRSFIEEALVSVEGYSMGEPVDLVKLDGTWRLQYTSAPDVLILFESAARLPFFQIGQIFQKFECQDQSNGGIVRNVVRWSIPRLLESDFESQVELKNAMWRNQIMDQEGATLLVSANFTLVSPRNIYLRFEEITVQNIKISEELQALIAPALLPRSFLSLQILQFIRSFKAQLPVRDPGRQSVGGLYYLSYLDNNMLLGRAVGGGVFVFTRAQPLD